MFSIYIYAHSQSWREMVSTTHLKLIIVDGTPCPGALVDDGDISGTSTSSSAISLQFIVFPSVVVVLSKNATYSPLVSFELHGKPLI